MILERLKQEDGFTVIEGVVASMIFAIAAIAVLSAFDGARRATYRAEQSQVANEVAQRELEALRSKSYSQLAMTSAPVYQSAESDPRHRVAGTTFQLTDGDAGSAGQMVIQGGSLAGGGVVAGGTVNPGPVPFTSGDVTGTIHRFVVWRDDPNCALFCPGTQDIKRAVVAVTIDASPVGGGERYVELQSDMIDPDESIASNPNLPLLGDPTVAQQFWLSDQTCTNPGEPAVAETLTNHSLHETGGRSCTLARPPDALQTSAPKNTNSSWDFATNVEPATGSDSGLQMTLPSSASCNLLTAGRTDTERHIWVSRRTGITGGYAMTGGATLKLWSRSINDATVSGKLCAVLFVRTDGTLVSPQVDVPVLNSSTGNGYFTFEQSVWPRGAWEELTLPMNFAPLTVLPTQRIGLALGLQSTSTDQLMFQYDNLELESRLEVETTTPIG